MTFDQVLPDFKAGKKIRVSGDGEVYEYWNDESYHMQKIEPGYTNEFVKNIEQ